MISRPLPPLDCDRLEDRGHILFSFTSSEPKPHTGPGTQQARLMWVKIDARMAETMAGLGQDSPQVSENIPKEPATATVPLAEQKDL